jgi:hypothetical protein
MAHLITLTNSESDEAILFNLDTVVSIEKGNHNTVITTRWGRQYVKDTLSEIMNRAYSKVKAVDIAPEME